MTTLTNKGIIALSSIFVALLCVGGVALIDDAESSDAALSSVTYDVNGGTEMSPNSFKLNPLFPHYIVNYDGVRDGFTFNGWLCSYDNIVYFYEDPVPITSSSYSLTAQWVENSPVEFTITWNIDGVTTTTSVVENSLPVHQDPVKEGFNFVGWSPALVVATEDATYTAIFEKIADPEDPVEFTITWNIDGVTTTTSVVENVLPVHQDPVKEGFNFVGWSPALVVATEDSTYTAIFEKITDPTDPSDPEDPEDPTDPDDTENSKDFLLLASTFVILILIFIAVLGVSRK